MQSTPHDNTGKCEKSSKECVVLLKAFDLPMSYHCLSSELRFGFLKNLRLHVELLKLSLQ